MDSIEPVSFGLPFHPYADLFPLMEGEAFDDLVTDIEQNGLMHPIVLLDGQILDGRNRYRACLDALVPIVTENYTGKAKPLEYVISANLKRRHLDESQRAMVAAKAEKLKHGGARAAPTTKDRNDQDATLHLGRRELATTFNVSSRTIANASKVRAKGIPELIKLAEDGEIDVHNAAKVAAMPKADQQAIVKLTKKARPGAVKKTARAKREKDLANATQAASEELGSKLYNVIYADPPWSFKPYSQETGMDRSADNHYPTMDLNAICQIEIPAANDCALFLWATRPMLPEALQVMEAWGFKYKTCFGWGKERAGTGYWNRDNLELLLVGTKGNIPAPAPGEQHTALILAENVRHSEKPLAFAEIIEEMFPNAALLEMFARTKRIGWDAWGNQAK